MRNPIFLLGASFVGAAIFTSACDGPKQPISTSTGMSTSTGIGGFGGAGGSASTTSTGGSGGGGAAVVPWTVAAPHVEAPGLGTSGSATEMAAHPTNPNAIAFAVTVSSLIPGDPTAATRTSCTSSDLGVTTNCTTIGQVLESALDIGFGYDPTQGSVLIDAVKDSATPRLYVSTNGGFTYERQLMFESFSSTPWSARFVGGAIAVRTGNTVALSNDLGASYPVVFGSTCPPPADVRQLRQSLSVSPVDTTKRLLLCGGSSPVACSGEACAAVTAPPGLTFDAVALTPHAADRAVALARRADGTIVVLASKDGGKSFVEANAPAVKGSAGVGKIAFDRRPSSSVVVVSVATPTGMLLWRSTDAGAMFQDITPPADIFSATNAFRMQDFDVAADGAVLAINDQGTLLRLPPSCESSADCASTPGMTLCDPSTKICVGCATSADCGALFPFCDPTKHSCGNCHADSECKDSSGGQHCTPTGSCACAADAECSASSLGARCVPLLERCGCNTTADCAGASYPICDVTQHLCVAACTSNVECKNSFNGPVCDTAGSKVCVGCLQDADCLGNALGSICHPATKTCGCATSTSCGGVLPVCDPGSGHCAACLSNADCTSNPSTPVCNLGPLARGCAACVTDADCKDASKPSCTVPVDTPLASYCH